MISLLAQQDKCVIRYDEEGRLTKIERDEGQTLTTAYEYGYTGDGVRHMKKDHLAQKEYRYGCSVDCGGTPLRVYARELGSEDPWTSVEDYLQAGNALGYGSRWQFKYLAGELLMAGQGNEAYQYYPHDSNGMSVEAVPQACVCWVQPAEETVCSPLGYGGCEGTCMETPSLLPPDGSKGFSPGLANLVQAHWRTSGFPIYGNWCGPGHPDPKKRKFGDCKPHPRGVGNVPPVKDELDSCCCEHDRCYETFNCNDFCSGWLSCDCGLCDGELAHCALYTVCEVFNPRCRLAQTLIILYMGLVSTRCLPGLLPPGSGDGPPPPFRIGGPTGPCGGLPCP